MLSPRKAAQQDGRPTYTTSKPCANGHSCERYTSSGKCVDCIAQKSARQHRERSSDSRERRKAYNKNWRKKNPDKVKKWLSEHTGERAAIRAKRRASELNATPVWADLERIKELYKLCPKGSQIDHIIPLTHSLVCGLHVLENLQYLSEEQNKSKGNRFEPYWK